MNNRLRYEKRNNINWCLSLGRVGHGVLLEPAGEHDDHDASNHSHDCAATADTNDDNNDAYGRRLLSRLL
jgi:hypothetical protein